MAHTIVYEWDGGKPYNVTVYKNTSAKEHEEIRELVDKYSPYDYVDIERVKSDLDLDGKIKVIKSLCSRINMEGKL